MKLDEINLSKSNSIWRKKQREWFDGTTHLKNAFRMHCNTPCEIGMEIFPHIGKLEFTKSRGSIKRSRSSLMIEHWALGLLKPGAYCRRNIGNQGMHWAMIGALKGYSCNHYVARPAAGGKNCCTTRIRRRSSYLSRYGSPWWSEWLFMRALSSYSIDPRAFMPNQFITKTTRRLIIFPLARDWRQTNGCLTHFVAGAGTCGTIFRSGRFFKGKNSQFGSWVSMQQLQIF